MYPIIYHYWSGANRDCSGICFIYMLNLTIEGIILGEDILIATQDLHREYAIR